MKLSPWLRTAAALMLAASCNLSACKAKEPPAAEPEAVTEATEPAQTGVPVVMHSKLQYRLSSNTASAKVNAASAVSYTMHLQTPLLREGSGREAIYSSADAGVEQVQGDVIVSGQATLKDSDLSTTESLQLEGKWPTMAATDRGRFYARPPERSLTGEGMAIRLTLEAPMEGSQSATITNAQGSMKSDVMLSRPLPCVLDSSSRKETCKLELSIDPAPTAARDETGKLMLARIQEALAQPRGEWAMALLGQVYGATTEYRSDGGFVQRLERDYQLKADESTLTIEINSLVWTSSPGDTAEPKPAS